MTISTAVRDELVSRLDTLLGASVQVFAYRGEFGKDAILRLAKRLPAVAIACLGCTKSKPVQMEPDATYAYAAYIVTKQKATATSKLANPSDQAMAIEEIIAAEILTTAMHDEAVRPVDGHKSVNMSGEAGPMGAGFGYVEMRWAYDLPLPAQGDAAALATVLDDLTDVVVEIDFAHLAPDGDTPPDGTVDHTTHISGLDA